MFKAKHSLGQNFLIDNDVITKIIKSVNLVESDKIIEIGPGKGYLTKELKRFNCSLTAFEIDLDTKMFLEKIVDDKTRIIYDDFLNVDLNDYFDKEDTIHVIANIPYYITTPIITKLTSSNLNIVDMTFMVQKEVGERLSSKPGSKNYGYISVYLSYYYDVVKLFDVDRFSFSPVPNVDSAVIKLVKKEKPYVKNEKVFFKLIKDAFHLKRKNIKNNLVGYDLEKILDVLKNYNFDLSVRSEELPLEVFVDIANKITD